MDLKFKRQDSFEQKLQKIRDINDEMKLTEDSITELQKKTMEQIEENGFEIRIPARVASITYHFMMGELQKHKTELIEKAKHLVK